MRIDGAFHWHQDIKMCILISCPFHAILHFTGEEPAAIQRGHHLQGTSPIIFILLLGLVLQR